MDSFTKFTQAKGWHFPTGGKDLSKDLAVNEYYAWLLALGTGMLGVFHAGGTLVIATNTDAGEVFRTVTRERVTGDTGNLLPERTVEDPK